jgi:hypothetical protein
MSQGNIMFNDIFTTEQTEEEAEEAEEAEVEAEVEAVEAEAVVEAVEAVEAVEEAEETEEASEIDDDNEELWSGEANRNTEANSEVINPEMSIIAALFGFEPASEIQQTLSRIRRREDSSHPPPRKIFRNNAGKRIASEYMSTYKYIKLKSGDEFHFGDDDGKNIILNEIIEPNRLIRNIVSKIPIRISERLDYLGKFAYDEDSDIDSDEEGNEVKVQKRYIGNLKDAVYGAYIKEWRLRYIFKKLLIFWRIYRMNKTSEKEIDPITLSEPEKEVYIYDWKNKRKFIFDAKSLAILIESKLMYHEYGFAVPQYPKNPKNNVEFSYKQLVSLYNQLKVHGESRWGFMTLREYNFNKNRWHMYHKSALTMNSIRFNISLLDTYEARDLFSDFIFAKMDELGLNHGTNVCTAYQIAMIQIPTHWYLEKLKSLAISYYEAEHFGHNRKRIINAGCTRIFKKHNQFMEDLRTKNIIK